MLKSVEDAYKAIDNSNKVIDVAKRRVTKLYKNLHKIQDECKHDWVEDGGYKTCTRCDFVDVVIKRKRRKSKSTIEELI